jgi:hypothetical protein
MTATDPKSLKRRLAQAMKHEKELFADIAEAGSPRQAESAQRLYVQSKDAIRVAAYKARKSFPKFRRPPVSVIDQMVGKVNVWRPCAERALLHIEEKPGGARRTIHSFRMENRTRQHLVAAAMRPRLHLLPNQFASGGGTHAAIKSVVSAIEAGNRYVAELDISDYYPSVNAAHLREVLTIPKTIIDTTIMAAAVNLWPGWINQQSLTREVQKLKKALAKPQVACVLEEGDQEDQEDQHSLDSPCSPHPPSLHTITDDYFPPELDEVMGGLVALGRLGIPQGSPVSSLICEALLTDPIEQAMNHATLAQFGDNIVIVSESQVGVELTMKTLRTALASDPIGLPSVKAKTYRPGQPFDFLGHRLSPISGTVVTEPSSSNVREFRNKFEWWRRKILKAESDKERCQLVELLRQYVWSWSSAFRLWDGATAHRDQHLALVKELVG